MCAICKDYPNLTIEDLKSRDPANKDWHNRSTIGALKTRVVELSSTLRKIN